MQRLPPRDQLIMGLHTVCEVLLHASERLITLYLSKERGGERQQKLLQLARENKIPISPTSWDLLTNMVDSDSHQGVVAHIKGRHFLDVSEFLAKASETSTVLMLDQIFDPQNFGSLLRCAECLGAQAIAWSKNRGSDLTVVAAKTSSGASELLPLIRISNLADAVLQFQKGGFEAVVAILDEKAESAFTFQFAARTLLIVGSEGEGIQPLICKRADRKIYIPMSGKIESLNVAQSAAVLLALRQNQLFAQR